MTDIDPHLPSTLQRDVDDLKRRVRIMENVERLTNAQTPDGFTGTATAIASAGVGVLVFRWLHVLPLGTSHAEFWIFARKAAGAGTLTIRPAIVRERSPEGCSATGL